MGLCVWWSLTGFGLAGLNDRARTDTTGANLHGLNATVVNRFYFLQVRVPGRTRLVVGVTDVVPGAGAFTTDFAFSGHSSLPPC